MIKGADQKVLVSPFFIQVSGGYELSFNYPI